MSSSIESCGKANEFISLGCLNLAWCLDIVIKSKLEGIALEFLWEIGSSEG